MKMLKNKIALLLVILTSFIHFGCPDSGITPQIHSEFRLSIEEVVSTEATLKIQYSSSDSITIQLKRLPASDVEGSGQIITTNLRIYKECIFTDTLVQPKQQYTYTAYNFENGALSDSTAPLHITTLDTTSHNFIWETFSFGTGSSSVINDVAIVNDTLIYAVGSIYILDSTGQDETVYNAAKWDGKQWNLLQILVRDFGTGTGFYTLYAVYAFGPNDVWFASDADLIQWNGVHFASKEFFMTGIPFNGQVRRMWGTSSNNLYCAGLNGAIYHFTGSTWKKIESGTVSHIQDIWGVANINFPLTEVFCIATTLFEPARKTKLLYITKDDKAQFLPIDSNWFISSIWTTNGKTLYLSNGSFLRYRKGIIQEINFGNFISEIRGNEQNDIIIVGDYGLVAHYNGVRWKTFFELKIGNANYWEVAIKNNMIVVGGYVGSKALLTIGKRK